VVARPEPPRASFAYSRPRQQLCGAPLSDQGPSADLAMLVFQCRNPSRAQKSTVYNGVADADDVVSWRTMQFPDGAARANRPIRGNPRIRWLRVLAIKKPGSFSSRRASFSLAPSRWSLRRCRTLPTGSAPLPPVHVSALPLFPSPPPPASILAPDNTDGKCQCRVIDNEPVRCR